ncbi:MAG: hypothetical protein WC010_02810 [Candidatus Absconditabacterales bacterium]
MNKLEDMQQYIKQLSNEELWLFYANYQKELKLRELVRTNNIVGERGEFLTIETYNKNTSLPNLQAAPEGTQNIDVISRKGERYSIKTITEPGSTTGVFYGCGNLEDKQIPEKKFEYAVIVRIDKDFQLKDMIELNREQFLKFRKWHKTMRAWNLSLTKNLLQEAKKII